MKNTTSVLAVEKPFTLATMMSTILAQVRILVLLGQTTFLFLFVVLFQSGYVRLRYILAISYFYFVFNLVLENNKQCCPFCHSQITANEMVSYNFLISILLVFYFSHGKIT